MQMQGPLVLADRPSIWRQWARTHEVPAPPAEVRITQRIGIPRIEVIAHAARVILDDVLGVDVIGIVDVEARGLHTLDRRYGDPFEHGPYSHPLTNVAGTNWCRPDCKVRRVREAADVKVAWEVEVLLRVPLPIQREEWIDLDVACAVCVHREDCHRHVLDQVRELLHDDRRVLDALRVWRRPLVLDAVPHQALDDPPPNSRPRLAAELDLRSGHHKLVGDQVLARRRNIPRLDRRGLTEAAEAAVLVLHASDWVAERAPMACQAVVPCVGFIELAWEAAPSELGKSLWVVERLLHLQHRLLSDAQDGLLSHLPGGVQPNKFSVSQRCAEYQRRAARHEIRGHRARCLRRRNHDLWRPHPRRPHHDPHAVAGLVDQHAVEADVAAVHGLPLRELEDPRGVAPLELMEAHGVSIDGACSDDAELDPRPFVSGTPSARRQWHEHLGATEVDHIRVHGDDLPPDGLCTVNRDRRDGDTRARCLHRVLKDMAGIGLVDLREPQLVKDNLHETCCLAGEGFRIARVGVVPSAAVRAVERRQLACSLQFWRDWSQ
mmetsp:Transcript_128233/g.319907  ORF Transcript_128233/g.319907 Transcript_128233/m.319907 type:complete len:549 (-) Transcript_128233:1644-3290(-)